MMLVVLACHKPERRPPRKTALRSFLRFLATEGVAPPCLDAHVESPRRCRGERLPRAIPWEDVLTLLRSIDRSTAKGRRDYAMLLLIATYGLRRSEVAGLNLTTSPGEPSRFAFRDPRSAPRCSCRLPMRSQRRCWTTCATVAQTRHTVGCSSASECPRVRLSQLPSGTPSMHGRGVPESAFLTVADPTVCVILWPCTYCAKEPRSRPSATSWDIEAPRAPASISASISKICAMLPCLCLELSSRRCSHDHARRIRVGNGARDQALP